MSVAETATLPPLTPERPEDGPAVEALIARAFGPGRYVKAAERLREGAVPLLDISFVARQGGEVVGCVRMWPVRVGTAPAVLLGPFAVDPACRSQGLGAALIRRAVAAARTAGHALIVLVGDAPYFGPLGFVPAPDLVLPGPVDRRRIFALALQPGAADQLSGPVTRG
ncbi:MAG TPA: N-acetyltransferase [Caulobacteraceae bacterium]|nr:N-acetyltransferase [Caulobacteraceae bacterium]